MHCLDCTLQNHAHNPAVGVCHSCGAAACAQHATVLQTTPTPIGMLPSAPQRRLLSCLNCAPKGHLAVA
jgi:hypothetical protein